MIRFDKYSYLSGFYAALLDVYQFVSHSDSFDVDNLMDYLNLMIDSYSDKLDTCPYKDA